MGYPFQIGMLDMVPESVYAMLEKSISMTKLNTRYDLKKQAVPGFDAILPFFLKLYKLQLGTDPSSESRIELAPQPHEASDSDRTYTLRVNHGGVWRSRRMTLGRLGANIANKSTCYRVIFDDLMVVKIPPQPISTFNAYIEWIRRDWRIAQKLRPGIPCIVPTLSALLKKIPRLHHPEVQSPEEAERHYLFLLRKDPSLQNYLKIGETFAFFMNLSRYTFLNQVIQDIHHRRRGFPDGFLEPSDPLWETHGMDAFRIPDENPARFEMGQVLAEYEQWIAEILEPYGEKTAGLSSQTRQWLSRHLSGKPIQADEPEVPEGLSKRLPELLEGFSKKHRETIDAYRLAWKKEAEQTWMERNKVKLTAILSSIMALLEKLKTRYLSVRDLKPENIFLFKDAQDPGLSTQNPDAVELGLIDLETALPLDADPHPFEQPPCTGTPAFSTPSHLFPNPLLQEMLGDLKRTFLLQDTYAAVGLIFFAATGETLFKETGKLLPEIVLAAQKSSLRKQTPVDLFRHASWVFWHSAVRELSRQQAHHRNLLQALKVRLTGPVSGMLRELLEDARKDLLNRISALLSSQSLFQGDRLKRITALDAKSMVKQMQLMENKAARTPPSVRDDVLSFLGALAHLKGLLEHVSTYRKSPAQKDGSISVGRLMEILFFTVMAFMYRESWTTRKHPYFPTGL